ncbi:cobalamin biosynthesis protein [Shewanella youngdeokensis]|uniref:Cobalamin biosynthesis protein n=1 Tax=Shewanella youngdeokensis TaxID=2999068 RepID=A0ABZ0K2L2_9GAMM|nr:cobalamin biosynthesis protein [Shewanella sp. DAU334]
MTIAVHVITQHGRVIAAKLAQAWPAVEVFVSDALIQTADKLAPHETAFVLPLSHHISSRFTEHEQHICVFSVGIAARLLAPLLVDKRHDPAVVCVDEQGHFAVAFSGGHRGGANALTQQVAHCLAGQAVVTTASDNAQTLSVDMMGQPFNWLLDTDSEAAVTPVSACIVNQRPVLIYQQTGESHWWPFSHPLPTHIKLINNAQSGEYVCAERDQLKVNACILISDQLSQPDWLPIEQPTVIWRPRSLVVGIGCDRNTPLAVLRKGLKQVFEAANLSEHAIASLVSVDLKADETGIIELAAELDRPFITYNKTCLADVKGIANPSATVMRCIGVASVAEAACLHGAEQTQLLLEKTKFNDSGYNMTIAVCRRDFTASSTGPDTRLAEPVSHATHGKKGSSRPPIKRPISDFAYHIFVCDAARCVKSKAQSDVTADNGKHLTSGIAHDLRCLLRELGLNRGPERIKVSRSHCFGCCGHASPMVIYQGSQQTELMHNHGMWLSHVDEFDELQWRKVMSALQQNTPLNTCVPSRYLAVKENAK